MANTKAIKGKIKAIGSIKKITKTMEMVAVSKMKKSVSETLNLAEYINEIKFIINKIKTESLESHLYFGNTSTKPKTNNLDEMVIIFASNKGLCGSFNTNLYKETKKLIATNPKVRYAICFGKFAEKIARKLDLEIKLSILDIEKINNPSQINKVESYSRELFEQGEIVKVHAIYTNFVKMGVYNPQTVTLYPVNKNLNSYLNLQDEIKPIENSKQIYTFEPNTERLINKIIPKIVRMILFSYILESRASENSSRSFAMKRASESATELLGGLKITYNKIRQDGITAEIAEISAGASQN